MYYLSAEFLMGRSLMNAVQNLELTGVWFHTQTSWPIMLVSCVKALKASWIGQCCWEPKKGCPVFEAVPALKQLREFDQHLALGAESNMQLSRMTASCLSGRV